MSQLTLKLPKTLHQQLETLARSEGVSVSQYILFALARQTAFSYHVQSLPEKNIAQQRNDFANLLSSLGQASFSEIEKIMQERELVDPEPGLTSEVVKRLQERIANQKMQFNKT
ncbi:MAG: toxin-antitoxin system HicB family antitoxin [candidate division KSB1 bacterium]|nr:toxin-antitoxin system HicB family antitoxin [candidate division KSB1 bacterium]MDZ7366959.1 toxin-antitoxin system HicB family antitoxin [candidate division KSB1 bacterium]MDZ7406844.1 toxin-antitoxin system HicB family antitoxin [candidate division KSB1 bacterium]